MTNKEIVNRNLGLTFDFVHHLIDNPALIEQLPTNFKLEFLEKDFSKIEKPRTSSVKKHLKEKYVRVGNSFEIASSRVAD